MKKPAENMIELDRIYRISAPSHFTLKYQRDVICRVPFYAIKEETMKKMWSKAPLLIEGQFIQALSDFSKLTLAMRRIMCPPYWK